MFAMFVLWMAVFFAIFRRWRWTPALAVLTLAYTVVMLKVHMTDPIPLNF
jgi:lysylphosphatidylglycerol synthetase-like protein (DUF2156 family)